MLCPFMGTGATAKVCALDPKHRNFIGCDNDGECVGIMAPSPSHDFFEYVPNPESDVTKSEEAQNAVKQYLVEQKVGFLAHRQSIWKVPGGQCPVHVLSDYIAMFLCK